jgi:hypothetical protein
VQELCCHSEPTHDIFLGSITCARRCCAVRGVPTKQLSVDALSIRGPPRLLDTLNRPPAFSILTNVPFSVACHVDAVGVGRTDDDKSAMATPFTIATWHRHWLARVDTFKYDMIDILVFILSARNKLPMHPSVKVLVAVRHKQADMLPPDRLRPADHSSCRSARLARERIIGLVPIPEMKPCRLESLQSTWALTG